mmetsp:Transcript_34551/g.102625  ORF Transcript_34551/g.102625 Transcript_34551/m.102625 type:complete len:94 (-) Transcript_34551:22-303(-)
MRQNLSASFDVQMTSRMWMFIHVSHKTKCPLYVSPFFNSTNTGWPCAVFSRESGSIVLSVAAPKSAQPSRDLQAAAAATRSVAAAYSLVRAVK